MKVTRKNAKNGIFTLLTVHIVFSMDSAESEGGDSLYVNGGRSVQT